jgi:hypothetical protein
MSRNPIEMQTRATGRRRLLAALAGCMAAGLGASGCGGDSEAACSQPNEEPRAYIEVRDRDGACTECDAEGGLTLAVGLANGCDDVTRFTTPGACLMDDISLVRDSGEMISGGFGCLPAITEWELQPGEVRTVELAWGRNEDDLSLSWGPPEPGHYRVVMTPTTDVMTNSEIAPPAEVEIIVTEP